MIRKYRKTAAGILLAAAFCIVLYFTLKERTGKPEYIFLLKAGEEQEQMLQAYEEAIEQSGGKPIVLNLSEEDSEETQTALLKKALNKNTKCILVDAQRSDNLLNLLQSCQEDGIPVLACGNDLNDDFRLLHIGTVDMDQTGERFLQFVEKYGDKGSGFAVLCGDAYLAGTTDMLRVIRDNFEAGMASDFVLSDIIYQSSQEELNQKKIETFLQNSQNSSVIISITEEMTKCACEQILQLGLEEQYTVIGFGSEKDYAEILEESELQLILYDYDREAFGRYAAEIAVLAANGEIAAEEREVIAADNKEWIVKKQELTSGDLRSHVYLFDDYVWYESK